MLRDTAGGSCLKNERFIWGANSLKSENDDSARGEIWSLPSKRRTALISLACLKRVIGGHAVGSKACPSSSAMMTVMIITFDPALKLCRTRSEAANWLVHKITCNLETTVDFKVASTLWKIRFCFYIVVLRFTEQCKKILVVESRVLGNSIVLLWLSLGIRLVTELKPFPFGNTGADETM
jgi:hypothetical protein